MFRRTLVIGCLILGFFLLENELSAQVRNGNISDSKVCGVVRARNTNLPMIDSKVELLIRDSVLMVAMTDSLGRFRFQLQEGQFSQGQLFELKASKDSSTFSVLGSINGQADTNKDFFIVLDGKGFESRTDVLKMTNCFKDPVILETRTREEILRMPR